VSSVPVLNLIEVAKEVGAAAYFETSALTQRGLREAFEGTLRLMISRPKAGGKSKGKKVLEFDFQPMTK
jgi:hypothetical protein